MAKKVHKEKKRVCVICGKEAGKEEICCGQPVKEID
jgi:hypothetical protein